MGKIKNWSRMKSEEDRLDHVKYQWINDELDVHRVVRVEKFDGKQYEVSFSDASEPILETNDGEKARKTAVEWMKLNPKPLHGYKSLDTESEYRVEIYRSVNGIEGETREDKIDNAIENYNLDFGADSYNVNGRTVELVRSVIVTASNKEEARDKAFEEPKMQVGSDGSRVTELI